MGGRLLGSMTTLIEEMDAPMMKGRNEALNQPDEGDPLRDEVSDEAVEAAASVATGALPTLWYSTHCFGCPSRPTIRGQAAHAR
jgi:hypothetical protein